MPASRQHGWWLLAYRVPSQPSNNRVSVWRELKRLGVVYLQQCVCLAPDAPGIAEELGRIRERVTKLGGSSNLLRLPRQAAAEDASLVDAFRELAAEEYAKVVEECEKTVLREIDFEIFRKAFTFAEAEEIEQNLEKIRRWYAATRERDHFRADGRKDVEAVIRRAEHKLAQFQARVLKHSGGDSGATGQDAKAMRALPPPSPIVDARRIAHSRRTLRRSRAR